MTNTTHTFENAKKMKSPETLKRMVLRDTKPYIKLYRDEHFRMEKLSDRAWRILSFIMLHMKYGSDIVIMSAGACCGFNHWLTKVPFVKGTQELVERGVIYPTDDKNKWRINYKVMFKGDRKRWLKDQGISTKG